MTFTKKIISAVLALSIALSCGSAVNITASAVSTNVNKEDYVDWSLFLLNGEEWNEELVKRIEKTVRSDYDDMTYGDLQKITALNLSGLELEYLPPVLQYMFNLRTLDLSENLLCTENVQKLDLSRLEKLASIDISNNYLVKAPSWFVSLDAKVKDISNNLLATDHQRHVQLNKTAYYYILGDTIDENELKDAILSTLELSDGTKLPKYLYDPELPTYNLEYEGQEHNEKVKADIDLSKFVGENGVVIKTGTLTGSAGLNTTSGNENTSAQFKIYFIDGSSPSALRERLEALIDECSSLDKSEYTASSWAAYEASLKTAQAIVEYPSADTDMLKTALDSLRTAADSLVKGVNADTKKALSGLLAVAKTYKESDYSTASWERFEAAVSALTAASTDTDTTVYAANAAIKAFQRAQLALSATPQKTPDIIPKSSFEAIYGDDETITAKGTTRSGAEYTISFNGNDITAPADFNPEMICESANESAIRTEVGSASDYKIISFKTTSAFPGAALVKIDVSDVYTNGVYNLYKWDSSRKKGEYITDIDITDGYAIFTASSGGDYYISSVAQNFPLVSSTLTIDNEKKTVITPFKTQLTVGKFRNQLQKGKALIITDADGKTPRDSASLATGMTVSAPNSGITYTIVVSGDCNGDGKITPADSVEILRALVEFEALTTYEARLAADVTGDGWVRGNDAVQILRYCVGM